LWILFFVSTHLVISAGVEVGDNVVHGGMEWCIVYSWWEIVVYFRNKVYEEELI